MVVGGRIMYNSNHYAVGNFIMTLTTLRLKCTKSVSHKNSHRRDYNNSDAKIGAVSHICIETFS